jgi:integrase
MTRPSTWLIPKASAVTRKNDRMARQGSGIEVRGNAIRILFSVNGDVVRRTLKRDGRPQAPTPENFADAHRLAVDVRERIKSGTFRQSEYFPATGKNGQALTVGEQLDAWTSVQRIEPSTAASYRSAIRFWKRAPCDDHDAKLGDRALHRLKPGQVLKALMFRPGLNAKTVNN